MICERRHREKMDKSTVVGKCRNHFWCVIFSSIFLWFFLFYFHSSALISSKNVVRSLHNEYSIAEPNSIGFTETSKRINSTENREEPITGDGIKVENQRKNSESPNHSRITGNETKSSNKGIISGEEKQELSEGNESENEPPVSETEERGDLIHEQTITERRTEPVGDDSDVEIRDQPSVIRGSKPTSDEEEEEERISDQAELETGEGKGEPVSNRNNSDMENGFEPVNRTRSKPSSVPADIQSPVNRQPEIENRPKPRSDQCSGQYVYVHPLPRRFNDDILKECRRISLWTDMCRFITNKGLGPPIGNSKGVFSNTGWYATNQFTLDVLFYNRMKQYKCLTNNSSMASAIFVPFYAGFDISRYLFGFNTTVRDSTSLALIKWLTEKPEWKVLGGRDHFLVSGRITWDFRRLTDEDSDWGNKLMLLNEAKNMTMLVIESSPWHRNDIGIPYPTYFHPSRDIEVFQWQNRMRRSKKRYLFSFAGGPRPNLPGSIRGQIMEQCQASRRKCKLLGCYNKSNKCDNPGNVMKLFQSSVFCLQPPGDSYTRRSAFDSILAGCIPVFFHPGSAYVQYIWHLPKNYTTYSVLISEDEVREGKVNIEKRLSRIPKEQVRAMREQVIRLIPRVIYADPRSRLETLEDAFDLAVQGVIRRVDRVRKAIIDGVDPDAGYKEANSWKYNLFGTEVENEWDHFFAKPIRSISY
ncbi:xyloglucan galactosyltransferase KATAMARI1 homolog [Telopea speciosissima]|uniref:xyloglucan galactosyltransferase KATAMARI1 homolog n=1 Tax=Telopea speciosissima TaxID=54955 RepID=UPI001CC366FB|nr:xyloglucan galactosyltransferase KATAMARI1 homolog [Telopea speciosissima]